MVHGIIMQMLEVAAVAAGMEVEEFQLLAVAAVVLLFVFRGKNRKQTPRHEEPEEEMEFQPYTGEETETSEPESKDLT